MTFMSEPDQNEPTQFQTGRSQLGVKIVVIVVILVCLCFAVLRTWPERSVLIGVAIAGIAESILRYRIKSTVDPRANDEASSLLSRLTAAPVGVFVGLVLAGIFVLLAQTFSSIGLDVAACLRVGASCGLLIGLAYPRLVRSIARWIPHL